MSSLKRSWINVPIVCLFLCLFSQFPRTLLTRRAAETRWRQRDGPWRSTVTQPGLRGEKCHEDDNDRDSHDDKADHHLETRGRGEDQDVRAPVQWGGQLWGGGGAHRGQPHPHQPQQARDDSDVDNGDWKIKTFQVSVRQLPLHRQERCPAGCEQASAAVCGLPAHPVDHSPAGGRAARRLSHHRVSDCGPPQEPQLLAWQVRTVHQPKVSFSLNKHSCEYLNSFIWWCLSGLV